MSALSVIGAGLAEGLRLAAQFFGLKRVKLPPKLEGPVHTFLPWPGHGEELPPNVSWYELHICRSCGQYIEKRAAYTVPACSQRRPAGVELP